MSHKWPKMELGELIDTLKGCAFKSKDYVFEGIPIVRVSDFTEDSISDNNLVYLPEALAEEYAAYELEHNNIIIQTVGSWQYNPASVVGKVIKVPTKLSLSLLNQNAVKLIPKQNIDEGFLYYRLKDDTFKAHVLGCAQGAANQASITLATIKRFKFFLPPLEVQQKIAAILSAYDDLIENNIKRIKLLEEMAQITYEEWFVRMKFPEHENTPIDSKTGLPVGWISWCLGDHISVKHGYAYKGEYFRDEETSRILLTPGNFKIGGGVKLDKLKYYDEQAENPKEYVLGTHDLLITMTDLSKSADTLGYPLLVPSSKEKTYLHNQRLGKVLPVNHSYFPKYFYYMLFQDERYRAFIVGSSAGATVKHTSPSKILAFKTKLPPIDSDIIKKFDDYVKPLFATIDHLFQQNKLLKEARDILLPRLMTGMIDVEQLVLPEPSSKTPSSPEQAPQAA